MNGTPTTFNVHLLEQPLVKGLTKIANDPVMTATEQSAGFIRCDSGDYQVFVKVYRYCNTLLKKCPESGGLLDLDKAITTTKKYGYKSQKHGKEKV